MDMKLKTYWTQLRSRCCFHLSKLKNQYYYITKRDHHATHYQPYPAETSSINTLLSNPCSILYLNDVLNSTFFKEALKVAKRPKENDTIKDQLENKTTNQTTKQNLPSILLPNSQLPTVPTVPITTSTSTSTPTFTNIEITDTDKENPITRKTLKRPSYSAAI